MQNKSKLGEKVSLGNTSRMLPPLSLCSFISLHSFIEDLNSSVLSGNDSLGVFSGKKNRRLLSFPQKSLVESGGNFKKPNCVFY